jgi:hypothetical protein
MDKQQGLWVNSVFLLALYSKHKGKDRLLQHFLALYEAAKANALSYSTK